MVEVQNLTRSFGAVKALDAVDLAVGAGEFFSLLGPSGCGKTTLLRIVAGLEIEDAGRVRIAGQDMRGVPAHRRPVNTVFQSYALFPHLTVRDNVAFGLRMKGVREPELTRRVSAAMDLVDVGELADRRPSQLSGGQRQRVALARAVVNEPRVLLLDEPMAALDRKLRGQVQSELRRLQRRLGLTFLLVTHDQEEALVLSDRIAVMRAGRLEQVGTPQALYEKPRTRFVAGFLGRCSLIEARRCPGSDAGGNPEWLAETGLGRLRVAGPAPAREQVTLSIRPERVLPWAGGASADNVIPGRVLTATYLGASTRYEVASGDITLECEGPMPGPRWTVGDAVQLRLPHDALGVLDD